MGEGKSVRKKTFTSKHDGDKQKAFYSFLNSCVEELFWAGELSGNFSVVNIKIDEELITMSMEIDE